MTRSTGATANDATPVFSLSPPTSGGDVQNGGVGWMDEWMDGSSILMVNCISLCPHYCGDARKCFGTEKRRGGGGPITLDNGNGNG
jgi:hypothetical protein